MKKKNNYLIILAFLIILVISAILIISKNNFKNINYIEINDWQNIEELIEFQKNNYDYIVKTSKSKENTIDNPRIIENPFGLVENSYLVTFSTKNKNSVKVYLNEVLVSELSETKNHVIPIYGLLPEYDNKILLELNDGIQKEITITLDKNDKFQDLNVMIDKGYEDYLLFTDYDSTSTMIYNPEGKNIWNYTTNGFMDTIVAKNGNLLTVYQEKENQIAYILEIDYMGKIYNSYKINNEIHHAFYEFGNKIVLSAHSVETERRNDTIYIIDKDKGKISYFIDLYEIFSSYSQNFKEKYQYSADWAHTNSIYLDEEKEELLVSLRTSNSIVSINYITNKINYILTNKDFFDESFKDLIIVPNFEMLDQHSLGMDENGNFILFNNNMYRDQPVPQYMEMYNTKSDSYPMIFSVDVENKTTKVLWDYVYKDEVLFCPALSSFVLTDENEKVVNYSFLIKPNAEGVYEIKNKYMKVVILDSNDNIKYEAERYNASAITTSSIDIYEYYNNQLKSNDVKIYDLGK